MFVISNGDTKFQINLYAHDYEALALFSMMQFGYIYEQGRLEITDYPYQFNDTYTIKTLEKDEIEKRWDEIWTLTDAIIKHLKQAPVFYPGHEFTEQVYKEFFMDSETNLHIALSKDDEIIGMIESNSESDVFAFHSTKSVNVCSTRSADTAWPASTASTSAPPSSAIRLWRSSIRKILWSSPTR